MGSEAHVIVVGDPGLLTLARRRIEDLEQKWSRFRASSEISRLNAASGRPVRVSIETFELVRRAIEAWHTTGGLFDPTVLGDLIRAGYDRPFEALILHPDGGVSSLHRDCGGIRLDRAARTVTLPGNAGFDPGGIGKGLAADLVTEELLAAGAEGACVNLGGDLRLAGSGPDAGRWVVAIDHPLRAAPVATVALASGAVATSTVGKRSWSIGGRRRHHLIDPETGRSAEGRVVAVTALAASAAGAEVATKAALLAEPGQELAGLEQLGSDGLIVLGGGEVASTSGLSRYLAGQNDRPMAEVGR
jgi:thiamine biosynthesis lipoprotein